MKTICVSMTNQVSAWFACAFQRLYDHGYIKSVRDVLIMLLNNVGSYCYWGAMNAYTASFPGSMYDRYYCLADIFDYISGFKYDRGMSKLYLDFDIDAAEADGFTGHITANETVEKYLDVLETLKGLIHGDGKISRKIDEYDSEQIYHELTNIAADIRNLFFGNLNLIITSYDDQCADVNVNDLFK